MVHELRQLGSAEEFLEHRCHRFGIDKVVRHERGNFLQAHALLDGTFHTHKANAVLVFHQFANQSYATVAKMVDIVGRAVAVLEVHQNLDGRENIIVRQGTQVGRLVQGKALVELVTAHGRQVVVVAIAEQIVKEAGGNFSRGRRRRTQATVDFFLRLLLVGNTVQHKGVANGRRRVVTLGMQHADAVNARFTNAIQQAGRDFVGCFCQKLAGLGISHIHSQKHAVQSIGTHFNGFNASFTDKTPAALGDGLASFNNDIAFAINDVGIGIVLAVQLLAHFPVYRVAIFQAVSFTRVEVVEDLFLAHAHSLEQDGSGHFAATVDTDVKNVLVVKVKVQPGAAHGNDAARIQHFTAGMRFAAIMLKDDAGRTLQLVDDDTLGAVYDKGAFFGHQGQGTKIDILFLDVANGSVA